MSCDWQKTSLMPRQSAAAFLPPALVDETGWDILLALHSDQRRYLGLGKLASLVSASNEVMTRWLSSLEEQQLVTGNKNMHTGELRALLTPAGRELLDRYLSATTDLQLSAHH
jgi:DNA-binding MarR family transcriptional regulator